MPNNQVPDTAVTMLLALEQRIKRLENVGQTGNSSISAGAYQVLDPLGRLVVSVGYQVDGSIGLGVYDPATGTKEIMLGALPGGLYGLAVLNRATGAFQNMAGSTTAVSTTTQSTSSTSNVTFGDDPTVTIIIGASGQALVSYGAGIGTGGDNDEGFATLTLDGVALGSGLAGESVTLSAAGPGEGAQAAVSRTSLISGISPGTHTFSLTYRCLTGAHGVSFRNRYITVSPY